jgi:hypothetical protein
MIDDIGYVQQSREEMEVLFTLLAERYERGSVLLTSNLPFSKWEAIFKDPMTTASAIDRLASQRHPRAEHSELSHGAGQEEKSGRRMTAERIRKWALLELEAPPPDLRDLPRSCHPRWANQNRRGGCRRPRPGLAPEPALGLHPCIALSSAPVSTSVGKACCIAKGVIVAGREK